MIDYTQFLIIDTRMTVWEKLSDKPANEKSEIIAIDIALVDTVRQEVSERDSLLIRPISSKVSSYCYNQFALSQETLEKEGGTFEEAYRRLLVHYMSPDRIWGYWGNYAQYHINAACKERKLDLLFSCPPLDLSHLFSIFTGKTSEGDSLSIEEAYEHVGVKLVEPNNAVAAAKLMLRMGWGVKPPLSTNGKQNKQGFFSRIS